MSNNSTSREHEEYVFEPFLEARNEVSFDGVFKILTPLLLAFFRARGCRPHVAGDLAQNVKSELARSLLRRASAPDAPKPVVIQIGDLKLVPERRLFWRGNDEIHLSPKEFDLLAFLMKNAGFTLTHGKFLRSVWAFSTETSWSTYVHTCVRAGRRSKRFRPSPNIS
jgi:hypothetical protein